MFFCLNFHIALSLRLRQCDRWRKCFGHSSIRQHTYRAQHSTAQHSTAQLCTNAHTFSTAQSQRRRKWLCKVSRTGTRKAHAQHMHTAQATAENTLVQRYKHDRLRSILAPAPAQMSAFLCRDINTTDSAQYLHQRRRKAHAHRTGNSRAHSCAET
jgi:hypothetical protein